MIKNENIRDLFGITQEELAMLLSITRTQLAMYETSKRDIPLTAKQKLAELLTTLQKNKSISEYSNIIIEAEKKITKEWLKKEYKEIEYKALLLDRKINKVIQVREEAFKALEVVQYLESQKDNSLAQLIKSRAINTLNRNSLQHFEELQLKKESFEMLKLQIEKKLKF